MKEVVQKRLLIIRSVDNQKGKLKTRLQWPITFMLLLMAFIGYTQQTVTGTVKDASDNTPLVGVSIIVKGTTTGAITNIDGRYTVNVPSPSSTLIFSFTGFTAQEVVVGPKNQIDVILKTDEKMLSEVVVVGYTTKKKGEVTGSVSTINATTLETLPSTNLTKSLAGRVSGLTIVDRGGYPGANDAAAVTLLIRGQSTLNNNAPLIVIDGVPSNSFSFLSPNDIESFTVLKDAAAAIYGARAANGVILITTRRGADGKPRFSFTTTNSLSTFAKLPQMMNSYQYATYKNEYDARNGNPLVYTKDDIANFQSGTDPIKYPTTNWYGLTMANYAPETRNNLSISGGNDKVKYFISGNYNNQIGQYASRDIGFRQYQIRTNLDVTLHKYIKLGVDLFASSDKRYEPGVDKGFIHKQLQVTLPNRVGQYPNGLYGFAAENGANPAVMASSASGFRNQNNYELRGRTTLDINLDWITPGLALRGTATSTLVNAYTKQFNNTWTVYDLNVATGEYLPLNGFNFNSGNYLSVRDTYYKSNDTYLSAQMLYNRTFGDHTLGGFVAFEQIDGKFGGFNAYKRDLVSADHPDLFAGGATGQTSSGEETQYGRLNYFGSMSYDYKKKYLIDLTLRRDGSSNFAKGNRFGTFPGAQVAWVVTKESFMNGVSSWLNTLKIRASWAIMGNDRVPGFQYLTKYNYGGTISASYGNYYIFGENPILANAFYNSNAPNPDITWELADNKNIGADFSLFNHKLSGTFNYFYQKRTDILARRNASIPDYTALQLPQENIGKVNSYGYEIELNYNKKVGDFTYNLGGNYTNARNKVVYLDEAANVPEWRKQEGHPMNAYLIYPTDGIFKNDEDVANTPVKLAGTKPGDVKYVDIDGNGKIDGNDIIRKYTSPVPPIQYGIFGGANYKGFGFTFVFQGSLGAETEVFFDNEGNRPAFLFSERWTPENTNADYPRAFALSDIYNSKPSNIWLRNANYLRLKNIEFSYSIPSSKTKFGDIRVFINGTNLLSIDKMGGFDPEMSRYYNFTDGLYSALKTFSLGANIQF